MKILIFYVFLMFSTIYAQIPLRVTEIMFHPEEDAGGVYKDFSYIELKNIGSQPLDLTGIAFTEGIKFKFPDGRILGAGEYVLVIEDPDHFSIRYPNVDRNKIAGKYKGSLKDWKIVLSKNEEIIQSFEYKEEWWSSAFDDGRSMVIKNPNAALDTWSSKSSWFISQKNGSPGSDDAGANVAVFDRTEVLFQDITQVSIKVEGPNPDAPIYYTTDGSRPSASSTQYKGPLTVQNSVRLRARAIYNGVKGPVIGLTLVKIARTPNWEILNLPVIIVETFGNTAIVNDDNNWKECYIVILQPSAGGSTPLQNSFSQVVFHGLAKMKNRGSSSATFAKKSFAIKMIGEDRLPKDYSIFGMPADSDWILYGASAFDRAWVRNAFMYKLSRDIFGHYAPNTRFCEVLLNSNGNSVKGEDYYGSYTFMEKPTRGSHRIDVEKMTPADITSPAIEGGWILKIDRSAPGESDAFSAGGQNFIYYYPEPEKIVPQQKEWVKNWWNNFRSSFDSRDRNSVNPQWMNLLDLEASIDHHIMQVGFAKNADALFLSTFLHKTKKGKFKWGPIWDFDRALGCDDDDRCSGSDSYVSYHFSSNFWQDFFNDDQFLRRYSNRYHQLRSTKNFKRKILTPWLDAMGAELLATSSRNIAKWGFAPTPGANYLDEISDLKTWTINRLNFLDRMMCYEATPPCKDKDYCTDDICSAKDGSCKNIRNECLWPQCRYENNNGNPCDDRDPCTTNDVCQQGVCRGTGSCAARAVGDDTSSMEGKTTGTTIFIIGLVAFVVVALIVVVLIIKFARKNNQSRYDKMP